MPKGQAIFGVFPEAQTEPIEASCFSAPPFLISDGFFWFFEWWLNFGLTASYKGFGTAHLDPNGRFTVN